MQRTISLLVFFLILAHHSFAQIRATTEDGKSVLLFENGTWQFEGLSEAQVNAPAIGTVAAISPAVEVDSTREISTEPSELFYMPSPRLVRYFGESGGNIRCKLSCSNQLGSVRIAFIWEIPVADGNRYFGYFDEGTKVTFTLFDGRQVELTMGDENEIQRLEKHNFCKISNRSTPLTVGQLAILTTQPIRKMEVGWKKKTEEYDIEQSRFLAELLPTVL